MWVKVGILARRNEKSDPKVAFLYFKAFKGP
ncbi:hypothetical protein SAMN05660216_03021 [Pseudomonas sp. LAMO17WK12:I8]|nr:hypothetical protein [Pseudomonas sp. OG7]SNB70987.1 hypothetical protein SAMN02745900_02111 [Pseudomonas sp. URIL14HWK12:I8]SNT21311.1 hypothetical protein SAMN05660216_03021 [Pseudomonas sp. LAMO17WK12:I8]